MHKAMNTKLLLILIIIAGLSSCSTAYKSAQTPDDVYYSPTPPHVDYVRTDNDENRDVYNGQSNEDREIRRAIHNRRLRTYPDYDYGYGYGYDYYPYGYYPYVYYPYGYTPVYIDPKNGKAPVTSSQPRKFNLGTYRNPGTTIPSNSSVIGSKTGNQPSSAPVRTFRTQPANNGSTVGNLIRKVFSGSNSSSSSNDNSTQTRTFESKNSNSSNNNSSNGSNRSSSSSSNAAVRSFPKK
jgi:hypothetical protein